jgi:hypothetical protein
MKVKPKEIMVNLPAAHLFQNEDEMAQFAAAINTIIHGKVKIKYEVLGTLGGQYVGLFYVQRNNESQEIHDEFMRLIQQEEMPSPFPLSDQEQFEFDAAGDEGPLYVHTMCLDCDAFIYLHQKGLDHCVCGEEWQHGKCESQS